MKTSVLRAPKKCADYRDQLGKPFEHETRLKELLVKQAELNAALEFDKGERQVAPEEAGEPESDDAPTPVRASAWKDREMPRRTRVYSR
jgi:hypothetical protein